MKKRKAQIRDMEVFISRDLVPDSIFKATLEANGITVKGLALIELEAVEFEDVPTTDWIFFYSRNAVKYFFAGLKTELSDSVRYACIGRATADALQVYQSKIDFIGSGKPAETAAEFVKLASNQRVLFPRARHSRQSIQKALQKYIISLDLVVYNNKPKVSCSMTDSRYLVFTSPLNVEAYFRNNHLQPHQKLVAIGESTAAALRKRGYCEITIAAQPNESSLAQSILNLFRRSK